MMNTQTNCLTTNCLFCDGSGCAFCDPPKHPWFNAKSASASQVANFNKGLHPMGARLANNGQHCRTCANNITREMNKVFHKCKLHETHSPATDIRTSWAACEKYEDDGGVPF